MAKFIDEFKEFAFKGNVVDMAVGVIIGGAFGKIVSSVVADLIMPLIAAIGGVNTADLKLELKPGVAAVVDESGAVVTEAVDAVTWNYGSFIQNVIDFFIIAVCLFFIIKVIAKATSLRKKKEAASAAAIAAAAPEPEPTKEELLLTEIRDLLKEKK
ncbi:MAG: large-conductance mechanosensitive channel protein MscL [Bacteroidaceae bacterium]|nr:large-conductance mechanosensitive channel protein MscL [Bacteroidaceae bacterium]MDE5740256.1 large-conductance mechanosensitive channel protein MscL [Bacteroidaceae bacterium]